MLTETRYEYIVLGDEHPTLVGTTMKVKELIAERLAWGWRQRPAMRVTLHSASWLATPCCWLITGAIRPSRCSSICCAAPA